MWCSDIKDIGMKREFREKRKLYPQL